MAKFVVNPKGTGFREIEAEKVRLNDGYWYFLDEGGNMKHVVIASGVHEIERRED